MNPIMHVVVKLLFYGGIILVIVNLLAFLSLFYIEIIQPLKVYYYVDFSDFLSTLIPRLNYFFINAKADLSLSGLYLIGLSEVIKILFIDSNRAMINSKPKAAS
ncbi:hypothetical protein AJ85_08390 [Alkalihalobacillus alcalophilus ATCC 27647 = CGMCC 1.3604]|uniref:Uncharacterized protein n=1 Tax=Alkalihalobacillus alcalophilus ATCC 27647 = CGMCC 1.3604 TaxID=1218173 RepID=A0A094WMM5_ALKAL|nr:hypothetical protein [Alkalihalobacillus alcalophilus]KGA97198.1 hypothetical protein BALCAV_0211830 [Alkalihalobacillus alcalophilus ATCC 27647 = CGMCC 1.3604]MED1560870.1 hypothetical protein [Alkalihalobacillus alcalophilus]THG90872.1 hypothetical protein AJ85_08390 [Alkalihalobacillus alcalophilus ATCC 27647 = CGMCC 1.3604]